MPNQTNHILHRYAFLSSDLLDKSSPFRDRLTEVNDFLTSEVERAVAEINNVDRRFRTDAAAEERVRIAASAFDRIKVRLDHELKLVDQRVSGAVNHVNELRSKKASTPSDVVAALGRGFGDMAVINHLRSLPDRDQIRATVFADSKLIDEGEVSMVDVLERQPPSVRRALMAAEDIQKAKLMTIRRRSPHAFAALSLAGEFERNLEHNAKKALAEIGNGADRGDHELVSSERRQIREQRDANFRIDDETTSLAELQARIDTTTIE